MMKQTRRSFLKTAATALLMAWVPIPVKTPNKEMDFLMARKMDREAIAKAFQIPEHLISGEGGFLVPIKYQTDMLKFLHSGKPITFKRSR